MFKDLHSSIMARAMTPFGRKADEADSGVFIEFG